MRVSASNALLFALCPGVARGQVTLYDVLPVSVALTEIAEPRRPGRKATSTSVRSLAWRVRIGSRSQDPTISAVNVATTYLESSAGQAQAGYSVYVGSSLVTASGTTSVVAASSSFVPPTTRPPMIRTRIQAESAVTVLETFASPAYQSGQVLRATSASLGTSRADALSTRVCSYTLALNTGVCSATSAEPVSVPAHAHSETYNNPSAVSTVTSTDPPTVTSTVLGGLPASFTNTPSTRSPSPSGSASSGAMAAMPSVALLTTLLVCVDADAPESHPCRLGGHVLGARLLVGRCNRDS